MKVAPKIQFIKPQTLYHGSFCPVDSPSLDKCRNFKDFGKGFYLTSSYSQAKSFAKTSLKKAILNGFVKNNSNTAYISVFKFSPNSELKIYSFNTADSAWLHCVVSHRKVQFFSDIQEQMKHYDIITGKIANDNTNTTITAYMSGLYGKVGSDTADKLCISLLLPERLENQFCFRTEKALSCLKFLKTEQVAL